MNNDHVEKIYQIMKQMHMLRSNIQPVGDISHSEFFMLKVICNTARPVVDLPHPDFAHQTKRPHPS